MESSYVRTHNKSDTGASAFFDDASARFEQTLNVPPGNRRADRIGEDRHKGLALAAGHRKMVLLCGYKSSKIAGRNTQGSSNLCSPWATCTPLSPEIFYLYSAP